VWCGGVKIVVGWGCGVRPGVGVEGNDRWLPANEVQNGSVEAQHSETQRRRQLPAALPRAEWVTVPGQDRQGGGGHLVAHLPAMHQQVQ